MNIREAKLLHKYTIKDVVDTPQISRRLGELGIYKGAEICVVKKSIFKQSYLIEVFGVLIAIRLSMLKGVILDG